MGSKYRIYTGEFMPTDHILALLIAERDKLNQAIAALSGVKRRGRPPKNPLAAAAAPKRRGRRTFTAARRKAPTAEDKPKPAAASFQPLRTFYRTAMVTAGLVCPAMLSTTGTLSPVGTPAGTRTFT